MSKSTPCIKVTKGPLAGQRFEVPPAGLRMGRSSSCEVTVQDPALSRNHCLFEMRDGSVWVTDLASANGTTVNGALLGADSVELKAGDVVEAGETTLTVAAADEGAPAAVVPAAQAAQSPAETKVDLGLGRKDESGRAGGRPAPMRFVIWAVALLAVAGAAVVILSDGARPKPEPAAQPLQTKPPARLLALSFEKVEADKESVYRYALSMDQAGVMTVEIDDVPKENRHGRCDITVSTSFFVPKAFTPLQWAPMYTPEQYLEFAGTVYDGIQSVLNRRSIWYKYHEADGTVLEGLLARGDRRCSAAILEAYRLGAMYDAWIETWDYSRWLKACENTGVDINFFALRERSVDEILPWDFIDIGVTKDFLLREWKHAQEGVVTPNCKEQCSGCGAARFGTGICNRKERASG